MNEEKPRPIRSFVRRKGRLSPAQQRAMTESWSHYGIDYGENLVDFSAHFARSAPLILEIGFGMGASLLTMAKEQPGVNFIGIDIHEPGIGTLLHAMVREQVQNIRVIAHDAVEVLRDMISDGSLDKIQIFFPDPWPKKRHHKRRLIQVPFVECLVKKLKPNGILHLATDWEDYAVHMQAVLEQISCLVQDEQQDCRPVTKYERRGQALGHGIWDFYYRRL